MSKNNEVMKDCQCAKCVDACDHEPGWFGPGEAENAAIFLGIPFEEFKKTHIIKTSCDNPYLNDAPFVWAPRKPDVDGDSLERNQNQKVTHGSCVFFKEGKCQIHPVKPHECRIVMACDYKRGSRDITERKWMNAGYPMGLRP